MGSTFPSSLVGFEPKRKLGQGGFGEVWLARQTNLGRDVAVKVGVSPLESADERQRFERECKALGRLSGHRNIVNVHASGFTEDRLPYIVMEYIDGGTLRDRLGRLPEAQMVPIAHQLCDGIQAAHDAGILHRDLKPENVFLRSNGEVVVGDFGIARLSEFGVTTNGDIPATVAYAAPETLQGQQPTATTDVYGIGITLITVAMGGNPFREEGNDHVTALFGRVLSKPVPSMRNYGMSEQLSVVLTASVAKNPAERVQTATDLKSRLSAAPPAQLEQFPVHAEATPQPHGWSGGFQPAAQGLQGGPAHLSHSQPTVDRTSSSRWTLAAGVVGVALVVVAASVFFLLSRDKTPVEKSDVAASEPSQQVSEGSEQAANEPQEPLVLPLLINDFVDGAQLPFDIDGFETLDTPANNAVFCNTRPGIDGVVDTKAQAYIPGDGTSGAASQRVVRFSTVEQAEAHVESLLATAASCEEWEERLTGSGLSTLRAAPTEPVVVHGDRTVQIDQVTMLTPGISTFERIIIIRNGTDVIRLFATTTNEVRTQEGVTELARRASEALGY